MGFIPKLWATAAFIFDPVQRFFNGNFWEIFAEKFNQCLQGKVLDLGCGTGEICYYIRPKYYLGVDLNAAYIKHARKRFNGHNFDFLVDDITGYSPKDNFDTVLLVGTAHHLSDEQIIKVCKIIKKKKIKNFLVVDGIPTGIGSRLLSFLDSTLAGGKYFRNRSELKKLIELYFKVKESGEFRARWSFYRYPFVVAQND